MSRALRTAMVTIGFLATIATTQSVNPLAADAAGRGQRAWYNDHWINMATDWETATACTVDASGAFCFTTEAELDEYLAASSPSVATAVTTAAPVVAAFSCGTTLRLYDGTSYTGSLLQLTSEGIYLNLGDFGFNNRTSSYKVGGCSSLFYSGASGGGSLYPTSYTEAGDQFPSMLTGWNNTISSVYIL
ncbi:MAG: hypothetical protein HY826_13420 [Actinobacteria bacterium]|nr:hypothetical protein [Actinomycetota bacterium]